MSDPTTHTKVCTDVAAELATAVISTARDTIAARDGCVIALSGGSTPAALYRELHRRADEIDWSQIHITFGDERCVPPDDQQSNYHMACTTLLDHVPLPPENILRMPGELDPTAAAEHYQLALDTLAKKFGNEKIIHDLILLGMGDDGHTASLFPATAALKNTATDVAANFITKLDTSRITLTFPCINRARAVAFMVTGTGKRDILTQVLAGADYPAAHIHPDHGTLTWWLDHAAAGDQNLA